MEVEKLLRALEALSTTSSGLTQSDSGSTSTVNSAQTGVSQEAGALPLKKPSFIKRRSTSKVLGVAPAESKARLLAEIGEALTAGVAAEKNAGGKDLAGHLALAIEHLLACCDDADASVRLAAEESLNAILKEHIVAHPVTVLIELFKQLKKNDKPRCLRAAWLRLAFFSNYAKPQRFRNRAFVVNLLPCIIQLARHEEDVLQEALAEGLPLVLKVMGIYLTEAEIKSLARTFLPSLSLDSPVKRRTAAANLVTICRYSKKPELSFHWLLQGLLGLARSSADNALSTVYSGVLLTLKNVLSFLSNRPSLSQNTLLHGDVSILIQILRLILDCCDQKDHNVQGFALDALHALLNYPNDAFHAALALRGALADLQVSPSDSNASSDFSLNFGDQPAESSEEVITLEEISAEALATPAAPLIGALDAASEISDVASVMSSVEDAFTSADDSDYVLADDESPVTEGPDFNEEVNRDLESEEDSVEEASQSQGGSDEMVAGAIGALFDADEAALTYIARYLCFRFLMSPDGASKSGVRVSVQNSALVCLADVICKQPQLLSQPLLIDRSEDLPSISAVLVFLSHNDPLLQAHAAVIASLQIADSALSSGSLNVDTENIDKMLHIVHSDSATAGKVALDALGICTLPLLYSSRQAPRALLVVQSVVDMLDNEQKDLYWLIKVELLQFLRSVPLSWCLYVEDMTGREAHRKSDILQSVLRTVLKRLSDADPRVARAAIDTLCWLPYSFAFPEMASEETYRAVRKQYEECMKHIGEGLWFSMQTGLIFPYNVHDLSRTISAVEDVVSIIVGNVLDLLISGPKREDLHGLISALSRLSTLFPPTVYSRCWFGPIDENDLNSGRVSSSATGVLRRLLELATFNSIAADLVVHADILRLIGNLIASLAFTVHGKAKPSGAADESLWIFAGDSLLRILVEALLKHLARVLNITKAASEGHKATDVFPSLRSAIFLPTTQAISNTLRRKTDRKGRSLFDVKGKASLGALHSADVYASLFDALKKSWLKRRSVLSQDSHADRFRSLLSAVLVCLAQTLEIVPAEMVSQHTEEIIRYVRATISVDGPASIYCIQQLLRCLFACNIGQTDNHTLLKDVRVHFTPLPAERNVLAAFVEDNQRARDFSPLFVTFPIEHVAIGGATASGGANEEEWGQRWARSWETRRLEDLEALFKSYSKEKRAAMSETIRQFESVVIRSLQLYTCTTDSTTQVQVLDLLVLLLQLHVNYNVLDGEHIFLKYALKQVELMEYGQVAEDDTALLLPYLFRFFIHLSHDKFIFQQRILTYGHIMQLCDSLMASGRGVLSVLSLLFDDAVYRKWANSVGPEERDAQLEVVLSMVIRCLPQPDAFALLHRFVIYQLRNSAGLYELKTRDLVESAFSKLSPSQLACSSLQDFQRISAFLDVIRSQNLIESPSFERFFQSLVRCETPPVASLAFLSTVIDGFFSNGMVRPLLKLFANINQNHPLESPGEAAHDAAAVQFVNNVSAMLDVLGRHPSSGSLSDFVQCSLLKSLIYFVEMVAQGSLKTVMRDIHAERAQDPCLSVVCMVAWMRFRYASTGCDLEPRFWNRNCKFPLKEHIVDVTWNLVRSPVEAGVLPFTCREEAVRLCQDYLNDELSTVEVEMLQERFGKHSVGLMEKLFAGLTGVSAFVIQPLFSRPGSSAIQQGLVDVMRNEGGNIDASVLTAEGKEALVDAWAEERYSQLKKVVTNLAGQKEPGTQSGTAPTDHTSMWIPGFVHWVALNSADDNADSIAALMRLLNEETVLTILTDQNFSPTILRSCFRGKSEQGGLAAFEPEKLSVLFRAAADVLLQKVTDCTTEDHRALTVSHKGQRLWVVLAGALVEYGGRLVRVRGTVPDDVMGNFIEFTLLGLQLAAIPTCSYGRLLYRRSVQCLLVCLQLPMWSHWLRTHPSESDRIAESVARAVQKEYRFCAEEHLLERENVPVMALTEWFDRRFPLSDGPLSGVIQGLARFPSFVDMVRIPASIYKSGWKAGEGESSSIPVEFLQELSVLKEFIGRVGHFGWSSRRSFEEIWMALLSVLSSVPIDEESAADEALREDSTVSRIAGGRMALRCITGLLLESVLAGHPGNRLARDEPALPPQSPRRRLDSFYARVSRSSCNMASEESWVQQQFAGLAQRPAYFHLSHFDGLEESSCHWVMKGSPQAAGATVEDLRTGDSNQIDLKSCLKFVMDLYSHWTSDEKLKRLSPYILDELIKSTILLSNIFHDQKNFGWMFSLVRQIVRLKNAEDSMFYGHMMDAVGKVASVMDEEKDAVSLLKKSAEGRASQSLANRICCARMLLRLLQQHQPGDVASGKTVQWLLNLSTTIYELESRARITCGDLGSILYSILATEIDFFVAKPKEASVNPYQDALLLQLHAAHTLSFPSLKSLLLALARYLIDKRPLDGVFREQLIKTALESINLPPPRSLLIFGFLLCCVDPDGEEVSGRISADVASAAMMDIHSDPLLIQALERLALIQQRIGRCYCAEQRILGDLFLTLLTNKMPLHEVINRAMAEFQSAAPPLLPFAARLMATVVQQLKRHRLESVVEEWISLSFANFAQRQPPAVAVWSLACLFVCASTAGLTAIFPYLQLRGPVLDPYLREVFLRAAHDFRRQMQIEPVRQLFLATVRTATTQQSSDIILRELCSLVAGSADDA
ncbi:huntingtin-like [Paramacrobiotus metropolitanus]|uniref:huntingtin-like n=1 Tax=Paramacrobiotus metropolitanus TaxID=2943436 RepID=UPI002446544C|nr:huntingtin-like [Paramacrobiotus metropolitanus]